MQGLTTLDLATVLGEAHREELAAALRARPGPANTWRAALGRRLVATGNRLLEQTDRAAPSASSLGA